MLQHNGRGRERGYIFSYQGQWQWRWWWRWPMSHGIRLWTKVNTVDATIPRIIKPSCLRWCGVLEIIRLKLEPLKTATEISLTIPFRSQAFGTHVYHVWWDGEYNAVSWLYKLMAYIIRYIKPKHKIHAYTFLKLHYSLTICMYAAFLFFLLYKVIWNYFHFHPF